MFGLPVVPSLWNWNHAGSFPQDQTEAQVEDELRHFTELVSLTGFWRPPSHRPYSGRLFIHYWYESRNHMYQAVLWVTKTGWGEEVYASLMFAYSRSKVLLSPVWNLTNCVKVRRVEDREAWFKSLEMRRMDCGCNVWRFCPFYRLRNIAAIMTLLYNVLVYWRHNAPLCDFR